MCIVKPVYTLPLLSSPLRSSWSNLWNCASSSSLCCEYTESCRSVSVILFEEQTLRSEKIKGNKLQYSRVWKEKIKYCKIHLEQKSYPITEEIQDSCMKKKMTIKSLIYECWPFVLQHWPPSCDFNEGQSTWSLYVFLCIFSRLIISYNSKTYW